MKERKGTISIITIEISSMVNTGWLWATWLKHDMANIMVFLPRYNTIGGIDFNYLLLVQCL